MTKKSSLIDKAKTLSVPAKNWFSGIPEEHRADVLELRRAYWAGELPNWTQSTFRRFLADELGIPQDRAGLEYWLRRKTDG